MTSTESEAVNASLTVACFRAYYEAATSVESTVGLYSAKQSSLMDIGRSTRKQLLPFLIDVRQTAYLSLLAGKQGVFVRELFEAMQFAIA